MFRYLNDLDCDQQYNGLGVAPLPLHGQVRPIKVEQESSELHWQIQDENHPNNLSSTPPILRRKGRKRDAEEERIEQVDFHFDSNIPNICFLLFNNPLSSDFLS